MIEKAKARPEITQGPEGREVLWLASSEPGGALVTFLRSRGLALVPPTGQTSATPLKLLQVEASNSALSRTPQLTGRRLAVMHQDPGCADALAQALRAKGADVVVLSLNPASLERAETLDPDAVIMEASDFSGDCWEVVRALFRHPQLRFATVILATPEMLGSQPATALDLQHLSMAVNEVGQAYERVREQARQSDSFAFELADLGPSRSLRALLESGRSLRALFSCANTTIEIDLAEQIIVGAQSPAGAAPDAGLLGVHALNLLLAQCSAEVEVRSVDHPAHANVMAPLESALYMARELASVVRAHSARPVGLAPANGNAEARGKGRPAAPRQRTLIGVPAAQVDPLLLPEARQHASVPARPELASIPASATKRTLPPARPRGAGRPSAPAAPPPEAPPARAMSIPPPLPVSKAPPPPVAARAAEGAALEVAVEPVAPAPTPEPAPARSPQSALETLKLPTYTPDTDAELVRAFRARPRAPLPRRTSWIAAGACAFALIGWLSARGGGEEPASAPVAVTPQAPDLVPHARSAESPGAAAVAVPSAATAPTATKTSNDEPGGQAEQGNHSRESARRAGLLCNQGNVLRGKKMLPSARVKYLEALRVYPDYPRALAGLAQIALSMGNASEAVGYAKKLVAARPGQAPYHLLLGDAYRAAHDEKQARASYQTARRLGSKAAKERLAG